METFKKLLEEKSGKRKQVVKERLAARRSQTADLGKKPEWKMALLL